MLESFPVASDNSRLTHIDFNRFSESFREIILKYIPSAKTVVFCQSIKEVEDFFSLYEDKVALVTLVKQLKEGKKNSIVHANSLILAFEVKGSDRCIAIVSELDPLFAKKVNAEWVSEVKEVIEKDFLLIKHARVDSQTDLLNLSNLFSLLGTYGETEDLLLILVELPPKSTASRYVFRYSHKCVSLLQNFIQSSSALHFLGQSTFAILLQQSREREKAEIEVALVSYLKKSGLSRVHIGTSCSQISDSTDMQGHKGRRLLDEAWTALQHAAKRGPYSFCDFRILAHPENHPLALPDRNIVRRLSRLWGKSDTFCLVQFHSDTDFTPAARVVPQFVDQGKIVWSRDDVFVYLDGTGPTEAIQWAKGVISRVFDIDRNNLISAGVSSYPYRDFKKSELVFSCKKALLHAAFFGKRGAALFDAVSLNISGDVYFGDGDLAKAVKEYKRGLVCDPQNVNLHNSLGVALAMMRKLKAALVCFDNALAIDTKNFMALYNLGLGEQTRNRPAAALSYLERALKCYQPEEDGEEVVRDLRLQLGILSCELGHYQASISYLTSWLQENQNAESEGRVQYYLGAAYHGLHNNKKAMESLQRALRFDEMDDRALHLLARIYLVEGEGNDIALSLCRKSVELEPSKVHYRLALAEILLRCGAQNEARQYLQRCIKTKACKTEAQLLLGECYQKDGQYRRAKQWFQKVIEQHSNGQSFKLRAKQRLKEMEKN